MGKGVVWCKILPRIRWGVGGTDLDVLVFLFPGELVRMEEVTGADPLLSQQHQIFFCTMLFAFSPLSLSLFLYIERPPSQTTPTANLQSCKMDSRKIRLEGQLKTPTSLELAVPVRRVPATIFAPQISRMADMNSRTNMERTHGGLQPAPLGA